MFEARVQVWLEAQMDDNGVVVAVNVRVHSVQSLEDLAK